MRDKDNLNSLPNHTSACHELVSSFRFRLHLRPSQSSLTCTCFVPPTYSISTGEWREAFVTVRTTYTISSWIFSFPCSFISSTPIKHAFILIHYEIKQTTLISTLMNHDYSGSLLLQPPNNAPIPIISIKSNPPSKILILFTVKSTIIIKQRKTHALTPLTVHLTMTSNRTYPEIKYHKIKSTLYEDKGIKTIVYNNILTHNISNYIIQ